MAKIKYMTVGKNVLAAGVGGTIGVATHLLFLGPQFAGQMIGPVYVSTIVDLIVAFVVGVVTYMKAPKGLWQLLGYGVATGFFAMGLVQQFAIGSVTPAVGVVRTRTPAVSYTKSAGVRTTPATRTNAYGRY